MDVSVKLIFRLGGFLGGDRDLNELVDLSRTKQVEDESLETFIRKLGMIRMRI